MFLLIKFALATSFKLLPLLLVWHQAEITGQEVDREGWVPKED